MVAEVSVTIDAPRERVWRLVSDIEHAPAVIRGIDSIEILERPASGLQGLKWKETRTIRGRTATETMWISEASSPDFYRTEARSHGSFYQTEIRLSDAGAGTRLVMAFRATPESLLARILTSLFGRVLKRSIVEALQQDLEDIKRAAEDGQTEVS